MPSKHTFTPAEVCALLGISKSTLFRWEKDGILPPVLRNDSNGEREYTRVHLEAIRSKLLKSRFETASQINNLSSIASASEQLSFLKVLAGDDLGLHELEEFPQLSPGTLNQLARVAVSQYEVGEPMFNSILELVLRHSCELATSRQFGMDRNHQAPHRS